MNKTIRVVIACIASFALSFLWQSFLPPIPALLFGMAVGVTLGWLAITASGPNILPVYRVEVRPDDYVRDNSLAEDLAILGTMPRRDAPQIDNLHGVDWYDAGIPPKRHECWPQTNGWIGFDQTQRCACGALRAARFGNVWMERNSRKAKEEVRR